MFFYGKLCYNVSSGIATAAQQDMSYPSLQAGGWAATGFPGFSHNLSVVCIWAKALESGGGLLPGVNAGVTQYFSEK